MEALGGGGLLYGRRRWQVLAAAAATGALAAAGTACVARWAYLGLESVVERTIERRLAEDGRREPPAASWPAAAAPATPAAPPAPPPPPPPMSALHAPTAGNHSKIFFHQGDWSWDGAPDEEYKPPSDGSFRDVRRVELLGKRGESPLFHVRYFEIAPGGYSSLEKHAHEHVVIPLRGAGECQMGRGTHLVRFGDVVYVSPSDPHQLRCRPDASEPFGFLCIVNADRDRPVPVTQQEIMEALRQQGGTPARGGPAPAPPAALTPPPALAPPPQQQQQHAHYQPQSGGFSYGAVAHAALTPPRFPGSLASPVPPSPWGIMPPAAAPAAGPACSRVKKEDGKFVSS